MMQLSSDKMLPCGHPCRGVDGDLKLLPCLHPDCIAKLPEKERPSAC